MAFGASPQGYPHRNLGILLLVAGIVMLAVGIALASYCSGTVFGVCFDYPYAGAGWALGSVGVVLLILGIVFLVLPAPTRAVPATMSYPVPPGVYAAAPATLQLSASPPSAERYCSSCGAGNLRSARFCQGCGQPLAAA